jgi:hypothetical protein
MAAFRDRIDVDGLEYCLYLYEYATIRLLAHKHAYYVMGQHYIDDAGYDIEEQSWYVMGRALGLLREDETSPCVGWDETHPLAPRALELAAALTFKKG